MMTRTCVVVCLIAGMGLLAFPGCNGTATENADLKGQVQQLKTALKESQSEKGQLQQDVKNLTDGLSAAESSLADTVAARDDLANEVQSLTQSQGELNAKVGELSAARVQLEKKVDELSVARAQLQKNVDQVTADREGLQERVKILAKSRDDLQGMVESLIDTRGMLEKQVASLTKSRDGARQDAKTAQVKMQQLGEKVKLQTRQMTELQDQIVTIRSVLEQLQQKLE